MPEQERYILSRLISMVFIRINLSLLGIVFDCNAPIGEDFESNRTPHTLLIMREEDVDVEERGY